MGCSGSKSTGTVNSKTGPKTKGMTLYWTPMSAPCRAVMMAAKHIGLNPELKNIDLMKGEQKEEWFIKINPEHTLPTLVDNGFTLWESRPMMQYLCNKYAPSNSVYPSDLQKRAIVDRWLYYDACTFSKKVGDFIYPQLFAGKEADPEKDAELIKCLDFINTELAGKQFIIGDTVSIADFALITPMGYLWLKDYPLNKWENLHAWVGRIYKLPYFNEVHEGIVAMKAQMTKSAEGEQTQ